MSQEHDSTTESRRTGNELRADGAGQNDLKAPVQKAQAVIEGLEEDVPDEAFTDFQAVERDVETLEDDLEDSDDTVPDGFEDDVQSAQEALVEFRMQVPGADADFQRRADDLEDALEQLEDTVHARGERYGVQVGSNPVEFFENATPEATTILARFGKDTDGTLESKDDGANYSGDDPVPLAEDGIERFRYQASTPGNS
jgi:hypothetical protein